jgi:hypothetical protein
MKNKVPPIILLLALFLLFSTCLNSGYGTTISPELPQWQVGNWWKFDIEVSGEFNLVGTHTFTVVSDHIDVSQNGQNFVCYQIDISSEGTIDGDIEGNEIEGTWTATEQQYVTKSDQSWVSVYSTYEETITIKDDSGITAISSVQDETITSETTVETTYDPPFEANKGFPLTVGKSWSAATTETTKTQTTTGWSTKSTTESEAYTKTFEVIRKESMTLSVGEVETYLVKRTDPDGDFAEIYYSPEVGFDVKQNEYNSTGTLEFTMELIDYEYQTTADDPQLLTTEMFQILMIVTIIVIPVIVAILLLRKKRENSQPQTINI